MDLFTIILLIITGFLVGFINTLAASATVISIGVLTFLGLPIDVANGTHRLAVFFQNITAISGFYKNKVLDTRKGFILSIPVICGSIVGAFIAVSIDKKYLEIFVGLSMLLMLFLLIFKPERWLKGNEKVTNRHRFSLIEFMLYFITGIYGGFVHVGVGIFLLSLLVLNSGYDLLKANALKNFLVFTYVPIAIIIYTLNGMVNFKYGLIHAIGNIIGAWVATRFALGWGNTFIRWLLVIILFLGAIHFLGILKLLVKY